MQKITPAIGICAAFGLIIISVTANAAFGLSLTAGDERFIYSAAFGLLDAFKAVLPVLAALAWMSGQKGKTVLALISFAILAAVSFSAEIGLYMTTKAHVIGDAGAARERYRDAVADKARIEARIAEIGNARSAAEIQADIETAKLDRIFARSKECNDVTMDDSRAFCGKLSHLTAELQTAGELSGLRKKLDAASARLAAIDVSAAIRPVDPQAETLARLAGPFIAVNPETVRSMLAVLIAFLIELGSGLGLWLSTGHRPEALKTVSTPLAGGPAAEDAPKAELAPAALTEPSETKTCPVERWLAGCVTDRKGAYVTAKEMLEAFASWCAVHGEKNIGQTILGRRLTELGYGKRKQGGTVRYLDIALRPVRTEIRLAASS